MKTISLNSVRPFVRYAKITADETKNYPNAICGCDCRLFYFISGNGALMIDGVKYSIHPGTLVFIRAGIIYQYLLNPKDSFTFFAFNFDLTFDNCKLSMPIPPISSKLFTNEHLINDVRVSDAPALNKGIVLYNMQHLYSKLLKMNKTFLSGKIFSEQRCSGLMLEVLADLLMCAVENNIKNSIIENVLEYISEHYSENISNQQLGDIFGYHPNYLNQQFQQHTGKSIYKYLLDFRILKAIELLQETNEPIATIAISVGFKDIPHFSRIFKQKTGYSPSNFR